MTSFEIASPVDISADAFLGDLQSFFRFDQLESEGRITNDLGLGGELDPLLFPPLDDDIAQWFLT
jgi:hypothetical protein